ncbi:MAG: hypothetical protein DRO00_08735 [Thermoproteota archaeon]|nr:MAG: hypothetical protein DRO00_08735 [Candidatus Korarchaeota archaeon]
MRRYFLLFVLVFCALSFGMSWVVCQDQEEGLRLGRIGWESLERPSRIPPGARGAKLMIEIVNPMEEDVLSVTGLLKVESPFMDLEGRSEIVLVDFISTISSGGSGVLEYFLSIESWAGVGEYNLTLELNYLVPPRDRRKQSLTISVPVLGKTDLRVEILPDKIDTGSNNMLLVLRNVGDTTILSGTLSASIDQTTPTYALRTDLSSVPFQKIPPGGTYSVPFTLVVPEDSTNSLVKIFVSLNFLDSFYTEVSRTVVLGVLVDREISEPMVVNTELLVPDEVLPGEAFEVRLKVANMGNEVARNVRLRAKSLDPALSIIGSDSFYMEELDPASFEFVVFQAVVSSSSTSGIHSLSFVATYSDEKGREFASEFSAGILVAPWTEVELINLEFPEEVRPGEVAGVSGEILVIGTESAEFLEVKVIGPDVNEREYIGRVDPDSPLPFEVSFTVPTDAKDEYSLNITLTYYDSLGRKITTSKAFNITISERNQVTQVKPGDRGILQKIVEFLKRLIGLSP